MSSQPTVAVNLLWLAPGRVGGSEEYLVRQLAGLDDSFARPILYVQPKFIDAYPKLVDRYETVAIPVKRDWRGLRMAAEHTWFAAHSRHADVVHHGGGTVPLFGFHPSVLTVHDLQYREFPQYFGRGRLAYLGAMMPRSARQAEVVCTPTEFVRETVIDGFDVDPANVVVVPHGIPEPPPQTSEMIDEVRTRFGIGNSSYVIYPAITHPHKGHAVLIEMLAHTDVSLVLIGGQGTSENTIDEQVRAAGLGDRVVRPGRVAAADRDALLAGAEALVFPSEYEGFGAPLVEAMALGVPVVCSDQPAIREVVGDAAIIVDEPNPCLWAESVEDAGHRRAALVAAGHKRRKAFTLHTSGVALNAAYRQALSK